MHSYNAKVLVPPLVRAPRAARWAADAAVWVARVFGGHSDSGR